MNLLIPIVIALLSSSFCGWVFTSPDPLTDYYNFDDGVDSRTITYKWTQLDLSAAGCTVIGYAVNIRSTIDSMTGTTTLASPATSPATTLSAYICPNGECTYTWVIPEEELEDLEGNKWTPRGGEKYVAIFVPICQGLGPNASFSAVSPVIDVDLRSPSWSVALIVAISALCLPWGVYKLVVSPILRKKNSKPEKPAEVAQVIGEDDE
eukprot:gnl/Dysnectes_brevis/689_a760_4074.p1 GENE.gnl/Dysnectes_brevis/689_a760_4074~~gnl/Dysnectes_brevis/689_a760_4074.p1  ORF type:complete len:208 (+),score=69.12 gnl/Dysnectes_brevis/689_a760_4074:150-773(+)